MAEDLNCMYVSNIYFFVSLLSFSVSLGIQFLCTGMLPFVIGNNPFQPSSFLVNTHSYKHTCMHTCILTDILLNAIKYSRVINKMSLSTPRALIILYYPQTHILSVAHYADEHIIYVCLCIRKLYSTHMHIYKCMCTTRLSLPPSYYILYYYLFVLFFSVYLSATGRQLYLYKHKHMHIYMYIR